MPDPTVSTSPSTAASRPPLHSRPVPFGAGLFAVVALFSILVVLGRSTDWWSNDESFTWDMIQQPARQIVARTAKDVHPPLHYLALKAWRALLPQPRGMCVFSMLMGACTLAFVALIGYRLGGARLGLLAPLLLAGFPFFLHYSQEARMYGMALCCETLALLGWVISDQRPRLGWGLLTLGLLAAFYTHNHCLIFGAALAGGELLRSLWARRRGAPEASRGTGPLWILSAGAAAGLGYLPWFFVLLRQVKSDYFRPFYTSPTWAEVAYKLFFHPYNMTHEGYENPWRWAPGVLLLGILPLLRVMHELARGAGTKGAPGAGPARRCAMVAWVGAAPFIFLTGYSMLVDPVFEITRHGLLFIPFLLLTSAAWLARAADRLPGRAATLLIFGVAAMISLTDMGKPRDLDFGAPIDALNARAPLSSPIVIYPPAFNYTRLMWSPLQIKVHELNNGTDKLTSCTLVIAHVFQMDREEIKRQAKRVLAQAASVKEIYASYNFSAYHLTGLPRGAIEALLWREPGMGVDLVAQFAGRWRPDQAWDARDLQQRIQPAGAMGSFLALNPKSLGARLAAAQTTLTLPAANTGGTRFAMALIGGYYVSGNTGANTLGWSMGGGAADERSLDEGAPFLIARLIDGSAGASALAGGSPGTTRAVSAPTTGPVRIALKIPESLGRHHFTPLGDVTPGVYLAWAGVRGLRPEECRQPGFKGEYFDIGGLGDELFLRSGFNEAEGMPPAEVRWTRERFAAELPVWPGAPVREVVLFGLLPAQVRERAVALVVTENASGHQIKAQATFAKSDYGEYVLQLPEALDPGAYHFEFTVGTFSPREAGQGSDSRRLGFFLNAIGLR